MTSILTRCVRATQNTETCSSCIRDFVRLIAMYLTTESIIYDDAVYGRPLSVSGRPCYIVPMFFYIFFMAALFSGPG